MIDSGIYRAEPECVGNFDTSERIAVLGGKGVNHLQNQIGRAHV